MSQDTKFCEIEESWKNNNHKGCMNKNIHINFVSN
jgi:hypothetical protein